MIKTTAFLADPVEYTDQPVPVVIVAATGHADTTEVLDWATGRTGPTERLLDAGMLLRYQLEHPGRGQAAQELLAEAGAPPELLDQLRAMATGLPSTTPEHSRRVADWAWDMITAPGGMVDRMPELAVPPGGPRLGEKTPDEHAADLKRMYLHLGATWAVGMLAELAGTQTTDLLEEIHRRRAARTSTTPRGRALAVAA